MTQSRYNDLKIVVLTLRIKLRRAKQRDKNKKINQNTLLFTNLKR